MLDSGNRSMLIMYDESSGPPSSSSLDNIILSSLSATDKWVQDTLARKNGKSVTKNAAKPNPYSRKEVSYVCETSESMEEIIEGIFRRLSEARKIAVRHGKKEEDLRSAQGSSYKPHIYRQTLVVVIPSNDAFVSSFSKYDNVIKAIKQARQSGRDFITDLSLENLHDKEELSNKWVTSVNLAHLHPKFRHAPFVIEGKNTDKSKDREVRRNLARRSPYPTLVIDIRSVPQTAPEKTKKEIDLLVVEKLEALFAGEDASCNSTEEAKAMAKSTMHPVAIGQDWVTTNDPMYESSKSSFILHDSKYVDGAFEAVFSNIAMQRGKFTNVSDSVESKKKREYLIMSQFLTKSATSFEKFAKGVENIACSIPHLGKGISFSTFHKEHLEKNRRSPYPILVIDWK